MSAYVCTFGWSTQLSRNTISPFLPFSSCCVRPQHINHTVCSQVNDHTSTSSVMVPYCLFLQLLCLFATMFTQEIRQIFCHILKCPTFPRLLRKTSPHQRLKYMLMMTSSELGTLLKFSEISCKGNSTKSQYPYNYIIMTYLVCRVT